MNYQITTSKSVEEALKALETTLPKFKFGLQNVHNMKNNLTNKGVDFDTECLILDVCNPNIAKELLDLDLNLCNAMPCKITIRADKGATVVSINPFAYIIEYLNKDAVEIATRAENILKEIIDTLKD